MTHPNETLEVPLSTKYNALPLFAGIHATAKAMRDIIGAHVPATVEFLPEAAETGRLNGFRVVQKDIREVDYRRDIGSAIHIVAGGPPCQPFSQSGRNNGENDERDMIPEFQRAVAELLPNVFVLENVRGLAGPRHKAYLARRISEFEAMGYVVEARVLDIADFGVGQSRKRLFMIGVRVDIAESRRHAIRWPAKRQQVTMAKALGWGRLECYKRNQQAPAPAQTSFEDPRHLWPLNRPSTTVVGSFRPEVQAAPGYRSAGDGPRQNAPGSVVTTFEERLRLQGLPEDWKVFGSKTKRDLQVGNSCPPIVMADLVAANL